MEDKDKLFNGKQRIFVASKDDAENWEELPIVENSLDYMSVRDKSELDPAIHDTIDALTSKSYSFSITSEQIAELPEFFGFKKMYDRAQSMLDEIKGDLKEFYQTNPPRNRKERRERAKVLKRKIERFNSYCKDKGIEISSK